MLKTACPCLFDDSGQPLVELSPFKDRGSTSDRDASDEENAQGSGAAEKAKSWWSMATAPLETFQKQRAEMAMKQERNGRLQAGSQMKLLPAGRGEPSTARVTLSRDNTMVTWQTINPGQSESGVLALSAVREVKPVLAQSLFGKGAPIPCQWMMVSDDLTVRFEAESEAVKTEWMEATEELRHKEVEAKTGRKMAYQAKRKFGLEEKRREAERRKAEVLKTCATGGMKHTANAMMNRA